MWIQMGEYGIVRLLKTVFGAFFRENNASNTKHCHYYRIFMGRRKKQDIEAEELDQADSKMTGDVKRSIVAIILFVLAAFFVLGFLSEAKVVDSGFLGRALNLLAGWMFGMGKYVSPLVLGALGVILLLRKEKGFYISKIVGLVVAFISILGFVHIVTYSGNEMFEAAKNGLGGGFVGYMLGSSMLAIGGLIGGSVILIALAIVGSIVAFNFSIVHIVEKFFLKLFKKREESAEDELSDDGIEEDEDGVVPMETIEDKQGSEESEGEAGEALVDDQEFVQDEAKAVTKIKKSTMDKLASWPLTKSKKEKSSKNAQWLLPPLELLETEAGEADAGDVEKNAKIIQDTFKNFGIEVAKGKIQTGPTVTQYSFRPGVGVKLSKITSLNDDLALALASHPIRIEAPIPGKSLIGIEVKNRKAAMVRLSEMLESDEFQGRDSNMLISLGKDISGNLIYADLTKMPHLLVAGTTGSGKSICINTILLSLLYQNSPDDLRLILVDPKRVELSLYNGIPHLLADVIVDNGKVLSALKWALGEMDRRYRMLSDVGSKDIISFNKKAEAGEKRKIVNRETGEVTEEKMEKLPYIVIVIDELADLMQTHGKEVEGAIIRLAQMARAIGIHLILSTQKPMVTVITSLIKSNIPTRIAFKVPALMDSRTILDAAGAEKLIGYGDMLFSSTTSSTVLGIRRIQGVYVSEVETKRVVKFVHDQKKLKHEDSLEDEIISSRDDVDPAKNGEVSVSYTGDRIEFQDVVGDGEDGQDVLYEHARQIVMEAQKASTSYLQRRLKIGYNRAAALIDALEENGIIGPADGAKPREILVNRVEVPDYEDDVADQAKRDKWQL